MFKYVLAMAGFASFFILQNLAAADNHSMHSLHSSAHGQMPLSHPTEGGQATFAAIIEIVALLESDDTTDWDSVNIDKLHAHLLDMNELVLNTTARTTMVNSMTVNFHVLGKETSTASIHNMVPNHARYLSQARQWKIDTSLSDTGAVVTVNVNSEDETALLQALGFYGFMSLDSHHTAHHLQIALGHDH